MSTADASSLMPGARFAGRSTFATGKNPTSAAVVTCTSGLVRYAMSASAPARFGAPFAIERPATTAM